MKKLIILIIFIIPLQVRAISAKSAIVMDLNSKRVLYQNNINEKHLIASTTKIMTTLIALENSDLNKIITVDEDVLKAYGSAIYIKVGEKITLRDLLYGLMLRSGNDAAIVIAKSVAGSMNNFTNLMNLKAQNIGMTNTYFYNAHGLEEKDGKGNISTAYDMALLTREAMKNKTFRKIFKTKKYQAKTSDRNYLWTNKNKLLHNEKFITGGKTGFTKKAKRTLVTTGSKDNLDLVIVTLNDPNDFNDHRELYNKYFKKYKNKILVSKKNFKINNEKYYKNNELYIKNDITLPLTKEEQKNVKIDYELEKRNRCINNSKIGTAKIFFKNKLINEEDIFVKCKKVNKLNTWNKLIGWFKKW